MVTSRRLLRAIASLALAVSATATPAQFVPPAGYSGNDTLPGVAPNPNPSAPHLTRLPDAELSPLVKPDPSYRRGTTKAHTKVVGAFTIDESKAKVKAGWSFGFLPIILEFDDGRCLLLEADYVGGTLSNGRLEPEDCGGGRPAEVARKAASPAGQSLRYLGSSWDFGAWADDIKHRTIVTAPRGKDYAPLFSVDMDGLSIAAMSGPDYPGGNITLVGRADGRLVVLTLEVGY